MTEITASNAEVVYKPLRKNQFGENRRITDKYWTILFFVILAIWIGSLAYVYHEEPNLLSNSKDTTTFKIVPRINTYYGNWFSDLLDTTVKTLTRFNDDSWTVLTFLRWSFSTATLICLLLLIWSAPKVFAHLAIAGTAMILIVIITGIGLHITNHVSDQAQPFHAKMLYWILPESICSFLCVSALAGMLYIGAFAISEILRKSCRIFFFYRYSVFFGFVMLATTILLLNVTVKYLAVLDTKSIWFYAILIGSCYLMRFTYFFGRMVMSMLAAVYQRVPRKNIPFTALFRVIFSVFKHHFGTIAFNATLILPPIAALIALRKIKLEPVQTFANRFIKFVFCVYLTFYMAEYSTIVTAVHNLNVYQSTKKTFQLLVKDCPRSLAFLRVFATIANITITGLAATDIMISVFVWQRNVDELMIIVLFNYIVLSLPVFVLMDTIVDTVVISVIDVDEDNAISEGKPPEERLNGSAA